MIRENGSLSSQAIVRTINTLVILLATFTLFAQVNDESSYFNGVYDKDKVKKCKIETVTITAWIGVRRIKTIRLYFDKSGFIEKQNDVDSNGTETTLFQFTFNQQGDLVKRIALKDKLVNADTLYFTKIYKGGRLVQESSSWFPKIVTEHHYDNKGRKVLSINPFSSDNLVFDKRVIAYRYDDGQKLSHVTDRVYNNKMDTIKQEMSDRTMIYMGDRIQQVTEKVKQEGVIENEGNLQYSYDDFGNILSIESDVLSSVYYTYNEKGLVISRRLKMPVGFDLPVLIDNYVYSFRK